MRLHIWHTPLLCSALLHECRGCIVVLFVRSAIVNAVKSLPPRAIVPKPNGTFAGCVTSPSRSLHVP